MERISYSQIRMRLAKTMEHVFTDNYNEIYKANCQKYSESKMRKMNHALSSELREFTHNVYTHKDNKAELDLLYNSVSADIICCFYYRYWIAINLLQSSQQLSPNEKFAVEEDEEAMIYQLLFDVVDL